MDYILKKLTQLMEIDSPSGFTDAVSRFVLTELTRLGYAPQMTRKGGILCDLGGEDEKNGLLLLAHTDTLGGMVETIKENGRLKLTGIGGLQPQNAEAENVRIYTRTGKQYTGTFQLENASVHVNKEYASSERNFNTMEVLLDESVSSRDETAALGIETGDFVCFDPRTTITPSGYIKSRFLDDKLSVAILLGLAKWVKEKEIHLPRQTFIHITVYEEVGHGGASSVPAGVTELLAVDMGCVGEGRTCDERKVSICVKDSAGPSDYAMTTRLLQLAKEKGLSYAADVYPYYGSDADTALNAGYDCRHALIGSGVYASHGYERSHIDGVKNTLKLIQAYLLSC